MIQKLPPTTSSDKWYLIPLLVIPYLLSFLVAGLIRLFRLGTKDEENQISQEDIVDTALQKVIEKYEPLAAQGNSVHSL
ncbi:MAG: hypothetical protein AAFR59_12180 [Bacteroidota bacterium]